MKKKLLISGLLGISLTALATPRDESAARAIAYEFLSSMQHGSYAAKAKALGSASGLTLAATGSQLLGNATAMGKGGKSMGESMYVYNMGDAAFVIVSGDDIAEPVLAYGTDGAFAVDGVPAHVKEWLQTYANEMAHAVMGDRRLVMDVAAEEHGKTYPAAVAPIMSYRGEPIQWDQNAPFNNDCPNYNGRRSVAGCVATAISQIMYYHRWPETCQGGIKNYFTLTYRIAQNFEFSGTTFNWDNMLPRYYMGKYTDEQASEAAKLTHAAGVAVEMDYAPEGSGTTSLSVGNALIKYFGYDKNLHYAMRDYYDLDEWLGMIKEEISNGRPICYAGTSTSIGHQFVFDGYDENNMVHVNWGWAGMSDGYFRLSALAPNNVGTGGGSATSGGFIYNQGMWLGVQRPTATSVPSSFFIIHGSSIGVDKTTAMLGENLTLTTSNYFNASVDFDGEIGMVLTAANGDQWVLASKEEKRLCGGGMENRDGVVLSFTGVLPSDLADGDYTLSFATRAKDEPDWKRIRADYGYNDRYAVSVTEGKAQLMPMVIEPDATGTLVADHAVYTRCRCQFTAKLTNTTPSEYFGLAHLVLYKETANGPEIYATCGSTQVSLPVGEEVEVVINGSIEGYADHTVAADDYRACIALEHQNKLYQVGTPIDVTVKRIPTGMAQLVADEFAADNAELTLDGELSGRIKVTNKQSVYSGNIGIILFAKGSNYGTAIWEKEIFLERGSSADVPFAIPVQWEPGDYSADLRFNDGYTNSIGQIKFSIKDEYSGIDEIEANCMTEPVYYTIGGVRVCGKPEKGAYIVRKGNKTTKIIK